MELMIQAYEWYLPRDGNHWNKLLKQIDEWKELGVTSIWLPPAYKGHRGQKDSGYGVYDMYDLGEFNQKGSIKTKYGTKDEFLKLVNYIEDQGIKVYHDIVLNHRLGGDAQEEVEVTSINPNNREEYYDEMKVNIWSKFNFEVRNNKYSSFKWNHNHFKATDSHNKLYLFKNKSWDTDVSLEYNNYDYLMGLDVDYNNPEVIEEIKAWSKWYFSLTGGKAIRLDAIKHIQARFFNWWLPYIKDLGVTDVVGEYWTGYDQELISYLKILNYKMRLFDVPFHYNLYDASLYSTYDLRHIFDNTLIDQVPEHTITFVDNHDTQLGQSLESWIKPWFKPMAYALILLRNEGIPCVFYKDIEELPYVKQLMQFRNKYIYGMVEDYLEHPHCIGWINGDLIVMISNNEEGSITFKTVGSYECIYGSNEIYTAYNEELTLSIAANSLKIFRRI